MVISTKTALHSSDHRYAASGCGYAGGDSGCDGVCCSGCLGGGQNVTTTYGEAISSNSNSDRRGGGVMKGMGMLVVVKEVKWLR